MSCPFGKGSWCAWPVSALLHTGSTVQVVTSPAGLSVALLFAGVGWKSGFAANAGATVTTIITTIRATTVNNTRMRLISVPFHKGRDTSAPPKSADCATLALGDEFPMNSWPTSENAQNANFAVTEFLRSSAIIHNQDVRKAPSQQVRSFCLLRFGVYFLSPLGA